MLKPNRLYFLIPMLILGVACVENQSSNSDTANADSTNVADNAINGQLVKYDGEIFSIPSPVQSAILIKRSNAKYNPDLLNSPSKASTYLTEYQKALNLGVYGADLAYLSNYGNKQLATDYVKEIEKLSSELDILKFIDNGIMSRFYNNLGNQDSLFVLNSEFYSSGDRYLKNSDRNKVAGLIIAGGWIEALHFSVEVAQTSADIRNRVGEQGKSLNSLIRLLSSYEDSQIAELSTALADLNAVFSTLKVEYKYDKPIDDAANHKTYLKSQTTVVMTDEQLALIREKTSKIRTIVIR